MLTWHFSCGTKPDIPRILFFCPNDIGTASLSSCNYVGNNVNLQIRATMESVYHSDPIII